MIKGKKAAAFKAEFDRRGIWTQHGAKHWYCRELMKINDSDWNLEFKNSTHHCKLLARFGYFLGQFPVGKNGRLVNVWVSKDNPHSIEGFIGDINEPRVKSPFERGHGVCFPNGRCYRDY